MKRDLLFFLSSSHICLQVPEDIWTGKHISR